MAFENLTFFVINEVFFLEIKNTINAPLLLCHEILNKSFYEYVNVLSKVSQYIEIRG